MLFFLVSDVLFISQLVADFHSVSSSYTSTWTSFVKTFLIMYMLYFTLGAMVLHAGEKKRLAKVQG